MQFVLERISFKVYPVSLPQCNCPLVSLQTFEPLPVYNINTSTKVTWIRFDDLAFPCYWV